MPMSSDVKSGLIFSLCLWGAIAVVGLGLWVTAIAMIVKAIS